MNCDSIEPFLVGTAVTGNCKLDASVGLSMFSMQALSGVNSGVIYQGCGRQFVPSRSTNQHRRPGYQVLAHRRRRVDRHELDLLASGVAAGYVDRSRAVRLGSYHEKTSLSQSGLPSARCRAMRHGTRFPRCDGCAGARGLSPVEPKRRLSTYGGTCRDCP